MKHNEFWTKGHRFWHEVGAPLRVDLGGAFLYCGNARDYNLCRSAKFFVTEKRGGLKLTKGVENDN